MSDDIERHLRAHARTTYRDRDHGDTGWAEATLWHDGGGVDIQVAPDDSGDRESFSVSWAEWDAMARLVNALRYEQALPVADEVEEE